MATAVAEQHREERQESAAAKAKRGRGGHHGGSNGNGHDEEQQQRQINSQRGGRALSAGGQRSKLHGIPTYNILENPEYMRAFAITDKKWAMHHTRVGSVADLLEASV